jgi:two-component system, chemotaxis family, chemotaxis protein CheY
MAVVMVIDDDAALRRLIMRALGNDGHEVIEAENGADALALLESHQPALVITDILMPKTEGIETINKVKERFPGIKIIAMSGGGMSRNLMFLDIARAIGAEETLAKPFRPAKLVEAVKRLLEQ